MIICKECGNNFETDKALHIHIKKHGLYQADYYCKHYPRYSLFYKQKIPFTTKKLYFKQEFLNLSEFFAWEKNQPIEVVKQKSLEMLKERIDEKEYEFAPFHNEIKTLDLPPINFYKRYFKSYSSACRSLEVEPLFNQAIPSDFFLKDLSNLPMLIDTREQDALPFSNAKIEKLFIGDYLLKGEYNYTFVDRKSENDFLGTLASGIDRFEREIQRTIDLNGYLFVVVESSIEDIKKNHNRFKRKTNLEFVFHNMRNLSHKYPRKIQFIFTGSRENSISIIPRILYFGKRIWNVDIQYFLDFNTYVMGNRKSKA